jgi:hypothetical protein
MLIARRYIMSKKQKREKVKNKQLKIKTSSEKEIKKVNFLEES